MKIIVSHDVDHLFWSEHLIRDLYFPKLCVRTAIQLAKRQIGFKTALSRVNILAGNRLHRIDELTSFLSEHHIPSTFFIGFANGLNLSYNRKQAGKMAQRIKQLGFSVGVHGISYNDKVGIQNEYNSALPFMSENVRGIRMHYLRYQENTTPSLLAEVGYTYDSTEYALRDPYQFDSGLWSFPIGVMDTYAVSPSHQSLEQAQKYTLERLTAAAENGQEYFVINTHDTYFDQKAYRLYMDWFIWLIDHLKSSNHLFVSYEEALMDFHHSIK